MAKIRDWFHLALFEKGISRPVKNVTGMVGNPKGRTLVDGHYYDLNDPEERMVMETRQEMQVLKSQAREKRSFRN